MDIIGNTIVIVDEEQKKKCVDHIKDKHNVLLFTKFIISIWTIIFCMVSLLKSWWNNTVYICFIFNI